MQIGVIGSGIAGLVASRRLVDAGHHVTLFERQAAIGMDVHSLPVGTLADHQPIRADVPSRMFNPTQWPALYRLYLEIGVETVDVCPSQSFSHYQGESYLTLNQANRPAAIAGKLLDRKATRILKDAVRLQKQGTRDLADPALLQAKTTHEYLLENGYREEFICEFLYPTLSSTVYTCSFDSVGKYPAFTTLAILHNLTRDTRLFRAAHGTADVVRRLLPETMDVRLDCEVQSVSRGQRDVTVELSNEPACLFDHVVVATQANTACQLVDSLSVRELSVLSSFCYETIPVFVHTDRSLMPAKPRRWSTFNMLVAGDRKAAMCSVWLNRFHSDWPRSRPVFQTINAFAEPDSSQVVGHCVLQRPVVNGDSVRAWQQIEQLNAESDRRIWFCGSYAGRGTPLLESGVVSATSVVQGIQNSLAGAA